MNTSEAVGWLGLIFTLLTSSKSKASGTPSNNLPSGSSGSGTPYTGQNTTPNEALYWHNLGGIIKTQSLWTSFGEISQPAFYWKAFNSFQGGQQALIYNLLYLISKNGYSSATIYALWVGNTSYKCALQRNPNITTLTTKHNVVQFAYNIAVCENSKVLRIPEISETSFASAYDYVVRLFPGLAV